jgi:type III secretion protein L
MAENFTGARRDLPRAPGTKIIRAAEDGAWRDGFRFLAQVRALEAEERAKGFAEGKAAGSLEASKLVVETNAQVHRYMASLDKQVAQLAFDIVQRVLGEFDDAELVARAARAALADLREAKAVTIKVHPSAEHRVSRAIADVVQAAGEENLAVSIETDAELSEKSCVLSTELAVVEATVETQLAAIAQAMGVSTMKAAP